MNHVSDLTVVVGLDAVTIEQWEVTLPTIAMHRSRLFNCRWVIFYDWTQLKTDRIVQAIGRCGLDRSPHVKLVPWPSAEYYNGYVSQRERMLTGFVFVPPQYVKTTWWMKIDSDALAVHEDADWLPDEWFQDGVMLIAPSWSYTKTKGDDRSAAEWAESLESFGDKAFPNHPRLGLTDHVRSNKIIYPRFCTWVSYYRTAWTRSAAALARINCGPYKLPVPSQDTYHWYVAKRSGVTYLLANQKRLGWDNHPRIGNLQAAAAGVLSVA